MVVDERTKPVIEKKNELWRAQAGKVALAQIEQTTYANERPKRTNKLKNLAKRMFSGDSGECEWAQLLLTLVACTSCMPKVSYSLQFMPPAAGLTQQQATCDPACR